jgi:hypothetical protein
VFNLANYFVRASAETNISLWGRTESCILVIIVCRGAVIILANVVPRIIFATLLFIALTISFKTSGVVYLKGSAI